MRFEWDAEKNRINQQKRRSRAIFRKDRIVSGEQRWHVIGAASGAVLMVVNVYRMEDEHDKEETVRIISARETDKLRRRIYIQQVGE
jgi:uncharacterized DUF497 family protein